MARRLEEVGSIALVERALGDIRKGKMVVLTDDEDRENEGDLVMAAAKVTPAAINFMATHGRGLICLSLTDDRLRQLNLPLMVHDNTSPFGTAFTVSIEAARGVTTGISAQDRARTIQAAVAPGAKPGDLVRPGPRLPLEGPRGRRPGAHRADGGLGGLGAAGRPLPRGRHLRGDESRRHHGAPAGAGALCAPALAGAALGRGPHPLPAAARPPRPPHGLNRHSSATARGVGRRMPTPATSTPPSTLRW